MQDFIALTVLQTRNLHLETDVADRLSSHFDMFGFFQAID